MPSNVTANFSLLLLSNISTPEKGNYTKEHFAHRAVNNTVTTGNDIAKRTKRVELKNTRKLLLKMKIAKKHPSPHHESTTHARREKSNPSRKVERGLPRENRHPTNRSAHLPARHQWSTPVIKQIDKSTQARPTEVKTRQPDLKSNIKALDEFAANASSLPEPLRTLANDSRKMACRTEVVCQALEMEVIEPFHHGHEKPTYQKSQSSHSRQKRGWFGVDEKKLAAEMGPYVKNITAVLVSKLQGGLVTVENMVENATNHVITTTDGFAERVDHVENMVSNATQHVMAMTDGFSAQVADIESMVKNTTQHITNKTNGFSDDALAVKTMVKNATDNTRETSSYVRKIIEESEENLRLYIYFSGAFILATGLICLLTAGCCHCRRSRHSLELTIDKRTVPENQRFLMELGHLLMARLAGGHPVNYKISRNSNRYTIQINSADVVIQAMLKDAFKAKPENEEAQSATSPLMGDDSSLSLSPEGQTTTGKKKTRKMGNSEAIKLDTKVTITPDNTVSGNKETGC